ncbi:26S proteasome non-ATPase regulatory subunit 4 [Magnaporthiopsis poae ATCC 64411]|uniref:26S proteasome non-ATPase regulatory subunit 4 n=1 Tax=Magnaporthiopsis poae (strain ATCC 64411 / 73-15) TaxID=644358 RepID=A0A0C4DS05_MAGP6|nr:26S proteasome non-ATPase regulatory subunit 4 [Magnaporthiopsis poae ATCC 64411]
MPLEAVMLVVDNSESSRNGDYAPTRFDAQADAVNVIFQHVISGNPESSVGLMSLGGKGPEVLVTLTTDQGKILEGLHRTRKKIHGTSHLATSIQVASLALKHRQNTTQRTRIVAFVCSPVDDEEKALVQLAGKLKKNNVTVDFVLFGDLDDETRSKLQAFNEKVKNNEGNSHLVVIPPSGNLLSDQLIATPIFGESAAAASAAGMGGGSGAGGGGDGGEFGELGFDPAADPELALALRMSMEEENARQEKRAREEAEAAAKASLESVEEQDESAPLLDKASGSKNNKKDDDKGGKSGEGDKMDTS